MKQMQTNTFSALRLGFGAAAVMALLSRSSHAQPGGGPGTGGPDAGGPDAGGPGGETAATVDCAEDGSDAHYEEFLSGTGTTMVRWAGTLTGCPNHVSWAINPNSAGVVPTNASIPAYPMLFAGDGTTDLSEASSNIGILRSGVAMFSSWAADKVITYEDTAFYIEAHTFDPCGGHAAPSGAYHYHGTPGCLQEQAGGVVGEHSPQLGWSYDGFPFYGQLGPGGIEMKLCGEDGADDTVCLDACSGYEALIDEDDYAYRYYASCGFDSSFFPFTANCYRGCCPTGVTCSTKVEACGSNPVAGYTDALVPAALTPLDEQYDADLISGADIEIIGGDSTVDCAVYLGSGGSMAVTDDDADGAYTVYSYAGLVLSGAITAAAAATLSV